MEGRKCKNNEKLLKKIRIKTTYKDRRIHGRNRSLKSCYNKKFSLFHAGIV